MIRLPDWRTRLSEHIEANRERPFEWGRHDCCLWAASCVQAMTGQNPIGQVVGTYNGPLSASQRLKKIMQAKNVEEVCKRLYGDPKPIAFARAGDIVLIDIKAIEDKDTIAKLFGRAIGICNGRTSYFVGEALNQTGLIPFDTLSLDCCYHV